MRSSLNGAFGAAFALALAAAPASAVSVINITGATAADKVTVQTLASGTNLTNSLAGTLYLFDEGTVNGVHSYLLHYLRTVASQDQYHIGSFAFQLTANETFDMNFATTQATLNASDKAGVTYATRDENRGLDCCGSGPVVRAISPFGDALTAGSNPIKVEYNLSTSTGGLFTGGTDDVRFFIRTGAVPEPASWAMMVMGFGLSGFALRRARKTRISFV